MLIVEYQAKSAFEKDVSIAQSIVQLLFDLSFEFTERSELAFCEELAHLIYDGSAKIESNKLSLYLRSLTTTLENLAEPIYLIIVIMKQETI